MSSPGFIDYLLYATYATEGLAISFGNGLLLLTILAEKTLRLRKEMLIIAGLCAADFIYGFGTLLTNVIRVVLIVSGLNGNVASAWSCILQPQIFMNNIGAQVTAIMSLVVSIDRYISVAYAIPYRSMSTRYAKAILLTVFIFFLLSAITMYAATYFDAPIYSSYTLMCVSAVFPRWYTLFQYSLITGAGLLSVIVYVFVFFAYSSYLKQMNGGNSNQLSDQQATAQRRLTVTLGMITLSTLIFFIVPFSILTYYYWTITVGPTIPLAIMTRVSSIVNIVIYVYRQKEVRPGMLKILRCGKAKNEVRQVTSTFNSSRTR